MNTVPAVVVQDRTAFWPIFSKSEVSGKGKGATYAAIGAIMAASLAMTFLFPEMKDRKRVPSSTSLLLGAVVYIIGFLIVVFSALPYLRAYNWIGTMIAFVVTLGGILIITINEIQEGLTIYEPEVHSLYAYVSYVQAGLLEEALKMVAYLIPILLFSQSRTVYDVVYLAFMSGCSFALFENVMVYNQGVSSAWLRSILCTLTHSTDTVMGAIILAYLKTREYSTLAKWLLYPLVLIVPTAFHGTYDFVIFVGMATKTEWIYYMFIPVTIAAITTAYFLFRPFSRRTLVPPSEAPKVIFIASV
jgi:RsiW-degrading membrane proteinase PrsW (M82 family)